jgi:hypothetical protein
VSDNVTVKVKGGWAVAVDGEHHAAPDVVTVSRKTADAWLHAGFVELVETPPRGTRTDRHHAAMTPTSEPSRSRHSSSGS